MKAASLEEIFNEVFALNQNILIYRLRITLLHLRHLSSEAIQNSTITINNSVGVYERVTLNSVVKKCGI